jgi:hypothetical protein
MKLPTNTLARLEEFWATEYESDYRRFIKLEELLGSSVKAPSDNKEMAAISTI